MRLRKIIVDLDQTLLDTKYRFYRVFNETLKALGGEGIGWEEFYERYVKDALDDVIPVGVGPATFWREFRRRFRTPPHPKDRMIPGAREALAELKTMGLTIVVATGREVPVEVVWEELEVFGLADYVDEVYTLVQQDPSEERVVFSRAGLIRRILRDNGVRADETVFVGDYWVDMLSGSEAGVLTVGVLTGHEPPDKLKRWGARFIVDSIRDVPGRVRSVRKDP